MEQENILTSAKINLISLSSIDSAVSNFKATFRLVMKSYYPELSKIPFYEKTNARTYYKYEDVSDFLPGQSIEVENAIEYRIIPTDFYGPGLRTPGLIFHEEADNVPDSIVYEIVYEGKFKSVFFMSRFPFDEQSLPIVLKFWRKNQVDYQREWEFYPQSVNETQESVGKLADYELTGTEFKSLGDPPQATFKINILRKPWFYTIGTTLSLAVITFMGLTTFSFEVNNTSDRVSTIAMLILSVIAIKFVISQDIPKVPQLTALDGEILATLFFLLTCGILHTKTENPMANIFFYEIAKAAAAVVFVYMLSGPIFYLARARAIKK